MAKKITLREIADLTGTSVSTVSKALNQSPEISENTRRRIIEVARVSHYRVGQQLDIYRDGHQQMIGFLVPDVSNPYFARLWQGVEDIARTHNYSVVACHTQEDPDMEIQQLNRIQQLDLAGLLTVPINEANYQNLRIPFMFLSRCSVTCNTVRTIMSLMTATPGL